MKIKVEPCCDRMRKAFGDGGIKLIPTGQDRKAMAIHINESKLLEVEYCPFCGKKVEID